MKRTSSLVLNLSIVGIFAVSLLISCNRKPGEEGTKSQFNESVDNDTIFNQAVALRDKAQYEEARGLFTKIRNRDPDSSLGIDSLYHIAITYYLEKQYAKALEIFQELVNQYPSSHWVPEVQFHIGLCLLYQGNTLGAKAKFESVVRDYAGTPWQQYARERLGQMQPGAAVVSEPVQKNRMRP